MNLEFSDKAHLFKDGYYMVGPPWRYTNDPAEIAEYQRRAEAHEAWLQDRNEKIAADYREKPYDELLTECMGFADDEECPFCIAELLRRLKL